MDDIVLLGADADVDRGGQPAPGRLWHRGAHRRATPLPRKVDVDVGRVHYNRWVYVGGTGPDIARAYSDVPVRSALKPGGRAWFVGAGGPMGRMHVQRAIQVADGPGTDRLHRRQRPAPGRPVRQLCAPRPRPRASSSSASTR